MPKISVVIEYDQPDDKYWLNPDNVSIAMSSVCKNTKFKVSWAPNGDPWAASEAEVKTGTSPNPQSTKLCEVTGCIADAEHQICDYHFNGYAR